MKKQRILAAAVSLIMAAAALPADAVLAVESDPADPPVGADAVELPVIGPQTAGTYSGGSHGWNILYPDGELYTVGTDRTLMARDVESYRGIIFGSAGDHDYIGYDMYNEGYLIQSPDNTLWEWRWDETEQKSSQEEIAQNIIWYSTDYALLNNGDLIALDAPDQVLMNDVETVVYCCALQKDGTLREIGGDQNGAVIDTGVTGVFGDSGEFYTKADGTYCYSSYENTKTRIADFEADEIVTTYEGDYLIYGESLYMYSGGSCDKIADKLEGLWESDNAYGMDYYINAGQAYNLHSHTEITLPFPQNEIAKYDGAFVLKTDGTLWQITYGHGSERYDTPQLVMTHVTDFAADSDIACIAVRTDGSVWYGSGWGSVLQLKQTSGPLGVVDPTDPPVGADAAQLPQFGSERWDITHMGEDLPWISGVEVLYPDGILAITNAKESMLIATDVKRYQSVMTSDKILGGEYNYVGCEVYGTDYLTLDNENTLWKWSWSDESNKSEKQKIAGHVTDFKAAVALLDNGDVIRTYSPSEIMLSDVSQISEDRENVYALRKDGTLWKYDYGNYFAGLKADETFVKIDDNVTALMGEYYVKNGTLNRYIGNLVGEGSDLVGTVQQIADFVPDAIYSGSSRYLVKGESLYRFAHLNAEVMLEIISDDFQKPLLQGDRMVGYVASDGLPYDLNGNALQLPFPVDEIVKMTNTYILTTDGTLWKVNNSAVYTRAAVAEPERVMTHVADFTADTYGESCYLVRTDGTVWAYNADSGVFDQAAGKPSVPPSEEPKEPTTAPTVDEDIITGGNGGNSGNAGAGNSANPGTGDSMIAFSVGALAAAAAGALLIFRKKSGK